jgi:hypothetical protein
MSQFSPTGYTVHPPQPADSLGRAVVDALSRPLSPHAAAWHLVPALLGGMVSFGVWPPLSWPGRLRELIHTEEQQFSHLAEWLHSRNGSFQTTELVELAHGMRFRAALWWAPVLLTWMVVLAFAWLVWLPAPSLQYAWRYGLACTYQYGHLRPWNLWPHDVWRLFVLWNAGLSIAYLVQWGHVVRHQNAAARFVVRLNRVLEMEGQSPVPVPATELSLRPLGLAASVVVMWIWGAMWALPMMLAGAQQKRYTSGSNAIRAAMAQRVRAMLGSQPSAAGAAVAVNAAPARCGETRCQADLRPGARFCPRCGTPVAHNGHPAASPARVG